MLSRAVLDGRRVGLSPVVRLSIPSGNHGLEVVEPNGVREAGSIQAQVGQPLSLVLNLERAGGGTGGGR